MASIFRKGAEQPKYVPRGTILRQAALFACSIIQGGILYPAPRMSMSRFAQEEILSLQDIVQLGDHPEDEVIKLRYGIDFSGHVSKKSFDRLRRSG